MLVVSFRDLMKSALLWAAAASHELDKQRWATWAGTLSRNLEVGSGVLPRHVEVSEAVLAVEPTRIELSAMMSLKAQQSEALNQANARIAELIDLHARSSAQSAPLRLATASCRSDLRALCSRAIAATAWSCD